MAVSSASALGTEEETEQVAETRPRARGERARSSNMALMLAGDCCVTEGSFVQETRDKEIMGEITDHSLISCRMASTAQQRIMAVQ